MYNAIQTLCMCECLSTAVIKGICLGCLWVNVMQSASICPTLTANGHCLSQQKARCTPIWLQAQIGCMQKMCVQICPYRCSHIVCAHTYTKPPQHTHTQLIGRVMHCPWQIIPRCTRIAPNISKHLFQCFPNTCFEYHIRKLSLTHTHMHIYTRLKRGFALDEWFFMLVESTFDSETILPY